jgi:endonuclease-3
MTLLCDFMTPKNINEFFGRLSALNPEPKTELNFVNTYTLLVAVVMSAQATDVGVNKATKDLFPRVQTPKQMVALGEVKLKTHIKNLNYFNTKARNVIALSQKLISDFNGEVPHTLEELQSLPGVGRKTANVVLNCAFGMPTMAVDTHVFRVANRAGLTTGKTPEAVEQGLLKNIPKKWLRHAHHWLILHGRYVCKARTPLCGECVVWDLCAYKQKTGV